MPPPYQRQVHQTVLLDVNLDHQHVHWANIASNIPSNVSPYLPSNIAKPVGCEIRISNDSHTMLVRDGEPVAQVLGYETLEAVPERYFYVRGDSEQWEYYSVWYRHGDHWARGGEVFESTEEPNKAGPFIVYHPVDMYGKPE